MNRDNVFKGDMFEDLITELRTMNKLKCIELLFKYSEVKNWDDNFMLNFKVIENCWDCNNLNDCLSFDERLYRKNL